MPNRINKANLPRNLYWLRSVIFSNNQAILWAASFYRLYRLVHLVTIFLQLVAKRWPEGFLMSNHYSRQKVKKILNLWFWQCFTFITFYLASRENNANYMQHSLSCVWFDLVLGHTVSSGSPQFLLLSWRRNHNYPSVKDSNHNLISNMGIVYICTQCGCTYSWDNYTRSHNKKGGIFQLAHWQMTLWLKLKSH